VSNLEVELADHTALVTGAGAGSGRAIALALAAKGASVSVIDLNIERADDAAEIIRARGGTALPLQADVSNRFQVANAIERTRDAFGKVDILVYASSILHAEPILQIDEWNWRRQVDVNITGAFFCLQLVGRVMADEGGGRIVKLAAVESQYSSLPAGIGYMTGGAGIIGMARQAARELAPYAIQVNCIAAKTQDSTNTELVDAALYLCSDKAKAVTGQVLVADEGRNWRAQLLDTCN
jgi:NAD(P)-dependent dehydrogenase (short-subunit alcohol dehydrogenase family)